MRRTACGLLCFILMCGAVRAAAPQAVPPPLQDWQAWVLHGHERQACPLVAGQSGAGSDARQCVWPGRLAFNATQAGAHFSLAVEVDAPGWVALPGGSDAWPQQVTLGNAPAVVLDHDGAPALHLAPGNYVVQGQFRWNERPPRVRLPASVALVDLSVDGKPIAQPERDGDWLALGTAAAQQRQADALGVRVFRKLADGMPPTLSTVIRLHVAGSAREQLLGPALPAGFVATALDGGLPARLDPDGRLRVQLRPGDWTLRLDARGTAPLGKLAFHAAPAPWPQQEVWSYADAPELRTTRAARPHAIDPAQADVPDDWRNLPAFVMAAGATLDVEQRARGRGANAGDQLTLTRGLWLDFDGRGLTAEDHLTGKLLDADRLDVAAPWTLDAASLGDNAQPLLVTRGTRSGSTGVEVRARALDLRAGLRRDSASGAQSATGGWQQTLDGVKATLHLPYGYRLLGAPGADHSPDSWVARWNLLDLFVAAVIALLAWKLLGWRFALAALGFVVLSHGEPGAPRWTPALAIALALVAAVLPQGRLRKVARYVGMAFLALAVLATLPFAAVQLRDALHPQLEHDGLAWIAPGAAGYTAAARVEFAPPPPPVQEQAVLRAPAAPPSPAQAKVVAPPPQVAPPAPPPPADMAPAAQTLQSVVVTGAPLHTGAIDTYPPDTVVQSGRGVPNWAAIGNSYRLGWSGPVTAAQTFRLVILPAWATRLLRVALLALLVAWLVAIARAFGWQGRLPRGPWRGTAAGVAAALLLVGFAPSAHADSTPSPQLLSQLQARLLEAPKCAPDCAASPLAQVTLADDTLQVTVEADVGTQVAFPLPHMDAPALLQSVAVDGKPATRLARRDGGMWVALERGVHRVALAFQLPAGAASASVQFALAPPNVEVSAPGWEVSGTNGPHLLSDTLTFTRSRVATGSDTAAPAPAQAFPPYVKLTRAISIGLDSRVDNVATRIAPAQGSFTISLPLLPGEHVSSPGLKVARGNVQVTFGPDQDAVEWSSTLDAGSALVLHAPALGERAEAWRITSAPLLHVAFSGVPEAVTDGDAGAAGAHVFMPLPGEALTVKVTRPAAVAGPSVAIDAVQLQSTRGAHAMDSTLTLATRSTRGGEQGVGLPRDAQLLGVTRDGQALDVTLHAGHVALPVQPGKQSFELRFRQASPLGMVARTAPVSLDARAANIRTGLALPHDRWVLWTWGPAAGPAVLYWAQLIVLLIAALVLARFAPTPLRWWQWLLLGLGFSTFAWTAYVVVVVWLIALGARARNPHVSTLREVPFNLLQVVLALLTLVALLLLIASVPQGLLGRPDMRVAGMDSTAWALNWFADQSRGALPRGGVFSLPLWAYKLAMLAWALWLANALIGWLRWGFHAWMQGGYWKSATPRTAAPSAEPANPSGNADDARL